MAQEALQKEWNRLRERKVWLIDPSLPRLGAREWRDVAREAREAGEEAHMGMLFEMRPKYASGRVVNWHRNSVGTRGGWFSKEIR